MSWSGLVLVVVGGYLAIIGAAADSPPEPWVPAACIAAGAVLGLVGVLRLAGVRVGQIRAGSVGEQAGALAFTLAGLLLAAAVLAYQNGTPADPLRRDRVDRTPVYVMSGGSVFLFGVGLVCVAVGSSRRLPERPGVA